MAGSVGSHESSGCRRLVLVSAWRHAELSRDLGSLTWGVVEEHWAGPIDDESVYRDFGEEPWRRWGAIAAGLDSLEPRMTMLVTRLVLESAIEADWLVLRDERDRLELERDGVRVVAWSDPGSWLRLAVGGFSWFETNDLAAVERVLDYVVSAGRSGADFVRHGVRSPAGRLEWGLGSWLEMTESCPIAASSFELIVQRSLSNSET